MRFLIELSSDRANQITRLYVLRSNVNPIYPESKLNTLMKYSKLAKVNIPARKLKKSLLENSLAVLLAWYTQNTFAAPNMKVASADISGVMSP